MWCFMAKMCLAHVAAAQETRGDFARQLKKQRQLQRA